MIDTFKIIDEYSVFMQKQHNELLYNTNYTLNQWDSIFCAELLGKEFLYSTIINDLHNCNKDDNYLPQNEDILEWAKWHKLFLEDDKKHKEDGHNFNIFHFLRDELKFDLKETMHSKLIKFFLDPYASHGQGNKFLLDFLQLLDIEKPEEGTWYVSAEQGRIDILLKRNEPFSVIIIENKSNWASDKLNQLYRYWYQEIYCTTKEKEKEFYTENKCKYQIIYLSPNENKKYEIQSMTKPKEWTERYLPEKVPMEIKIIYFNTDIQKWLENCKKLLPETNHRIREYITQYQSLCNNL